MSFWFQSMFVVVVDVDGEGDGADDASGHAALHVACRDGNRANHAAGDPKPNALVALAPR